jgi:hypothetical protein
MATTVPTKLGTTPPQPSFTYSHPSSEETTRSFPVRQRKVFGFVSFVTRGCSQPLCYFKILLWVGNVVSLAARALYVTVARI